MTVARGRFARGDWGPPSWRPQDRGPEQWGPEHLSLDAVVAFVDEELTPGAQSRATAHLNRCQECAAEVVAQCQARAALRSAEGPTLPSSLLSSLQAIPQDTELPGPPAGLAVTADGTLVSMLRSGRVARSASRPGTTGGSDAPPSAGRRGPVQRRVRLGAGAAVSGLALGALAFAAPGAPVSPPAADRGVLGGSVLGGSVSGGSSVVTTAGLDRAPADRLDQPPITVRFRGQR